MSLKSGCYQDLSIGGVSVILLTHAELEELKNRCRYNFTGGNTQPYQAPKDSPMNKWCALNQSQEQRFLDRRME